MPSLDLSIISTPERAHRRLLTEISPGNYELCLDNTTLEKLLTCPRAFEFYAVYGRDSGQRDALNYGSALHTALEIFYKGGSLEDMQDSVAASFRERPSSPDSWRNFDHALEAVQKYHSWRQQLLMLPWTPIVHEGRQMVETPFKLELFKMERDTGSWFEYPKQLLVDSESKHQVAFDSITVYWTGKIDLIINHQDSPWPVDHKTTSIEGPTFWEAFKMSPQMLGYCWATQKILGREVPGVIIDALIGRPKTRTGISHTNQFQEFPYTQEKIQEWEHDTITHIKRIFGYLFDGYFPKSPVWCTNKYGKCPYFDVCTMSKKAQPQLLMSGQYAERTWNPLTH